MRFIILLIIVCFTLIVQSRPSQNERDERASEEEEEEYEVDPDEKDSQLQPEIQDSSSEEQNKRFMEMLKNPYAVKILNKYHNRAEIADYKLSKNKQERDMNTDNMSSSFEGMQIYPKRSQLSRYFSNDLTNQQDPLRVTNRNANNNKANHNSILTDEAPNKRTLIEPKRTLNDDNDMLFEKEQEKNDFNNEPLDANNRSPKQYNDLQPESRAMTDRREYDNDRFYYNRDRRNIDNCKPKPDNLTNIEDKDQKENIESSDAEDGETAIINHIQKLSSEELQNLMNSLSDDKRNLLKKIIDDSNLTENDAVHKREITKKAEAIQDNSFNEDAKMFTGSISVTESVVSQSTDASDTNKQVDSSKSDNSDTSNTKNAELSDVQSKAMYTFQDPSVQQISDDSVNPNSNIESDKSKVVYIKPATAKNKREINEKDLEDMSKDDQSYSPQDQDSQVLDDDEQLQFDQEIKNFKRDVDQQAELDFKMKSLEDSFPNSDSYDESSGPLVRVKRKDADVNLKKRSAALLPDSKVAFFPYRSENDDDDEEGNEFDDEGFYERAHVCNKNVAESAPVKQYENDHANIENRQTQIKEFSKDSKLGTDTDSVLSGMNEVDEHLMFNSGTRNRRTTEDNNLSNNEDLNALSFNSKSSFDENKIMSESNMNNIPNYQENDAFGPLPQSYGGDLGRYKRIRRVKQSHAEEPALDTQVS